MYKQLPLFQGEISALKLASCAWYTIEKYNTDYKLCSFCNLVEWRCTTDELDNYQAQHPKALEYRIVIHENNVFHPLIYHSVEQNSSNLVKNLESILKLTPDAVEEETQRDLDNNNLKKDYEIFEYATQNDLSIFVSIDGSLDDEGVAIDSVSLSAPDIRDTDEVGANLWTSRQAKVLLIRS